MDIEKYVDEWVWWWVRHIRRGSQYDYMWHRTNEDGKPIQPMLNAFRFMHGRLAKEGKAAVKAAGTHKAMVRQTILEYEKTEYFKPQELWADIIQTGEEPVPGAKLTVV